MDGEKKQDYIVASFSKLKHKKWELYVITRIFHKLDDLDIDFVCQQPVLHQDGEIALLDLYFPQFNICIEIDEKYHGSEDQKSDDHEREEKIKEKRIWQIGIQEETQIEIWRIKIYSGVQKENRPIKEINDKIDEIIDTIRDKKVALGDKFVAWNYENSFSSKIFIKKGVLDIKDRPSFRRQHEALECFGFSGAGWQLAIWGNHKKLGFEVWFVRLVPHKTWNNSLSKDGERLTETLLCEKEEQKQLQNNRDIDKCVFAKSKDDLGITLYRFIGKFRKIKGPFRDRKNNLTWEYQRVATSVELPRGIT